MDLTLPRFKPFLFDRDFSPLPDPADDASPAAEDIIPAECFTEEDLHRARSEAFAAGQATATAEAANAAATRTARAVDSVALQLEALARQAQREQSEMERCAVAVALAVCRRMLPATFSEAGTAEITALIARLLPQLADQPALRVRVHGDLAAALETALQPVPAATGFAGRLQVQADSTLPLGDCRVEWAGGGLTRSWDDLWQAIEDLSHDQCGIDAADRHTVEQTARG